MVPRTNLEKQLTKIRDKQYTSHDWKSQVALLFDQETIKTEKIVEKLTTVSSSSENNFDFEVLETSKIYHLDQIRKICIDYRLRFLDAKFFKGKIPYDLINDISELSQ